MCGKGGNRRLELFSVSTPFGINIRLTRSVATSICPITMMIPNRSLTHGLDQGSIHRDTSTRMALS